MTTKLEELKAAAEAADDAWAAVWAPFQAELDKLKENSDD
jgi:hypothetical protein